MAMYYDFEPSGSRDVFPRRTKRVKLVDTDRAREIEDDAAADQAIQDFLSKVLPVYPVDFRKQEFLMKNVFYSSVDQLATFHYRAQYGTNVIKSISYFGRGTAINEPPTPPQKNDAFTDQNDFPSYAYLPDVVLLQICSYLSPNDLSRAGRTCRRWNNVAKSSVLWRRVDARCHYSVSGDAVLTLVRSLKEQLQALRVGFERGRGRFDFLSALRHLCTSCPRLRSLAFHNALLSDRVFWYYADPRTPVYEVSGNAVFRAPDKLDRVEYRYAFTCGWTEERCCSDSFRPDSFPVLPELRALSLRQSMFHSSDLLQGCLSVAPWLRVLDLSHSPAVNDELLSGLNYFPKLEELYLSGCRIQDCSLARISMLLPRLKVLDLEDTEAGLQSWHLLRQFSFSLRRLYVCNTLMTSVFRYFEDSRLPDLEELCLRNVNNEQRPDLIQVFWTCPKLRALNVTQSNVTERDVRRLPDEMQAKIVNEKCQFVYCNHHLKLEF